MYKEGFSHIHYVAKALLYLKYPLTEVNGNRNPDFNVI